MSESKLSDKYVDAHAIKNPYPMAQLVSDVEHHIWEHLSRGDKKEILRWANIMKGLMGTIIKQVEEES